MAPSLFHVVPGFVPSACPFSARGSSAVPTCSPLVLRRPPCVLRRRPQPTSLGLLRACAESGTDAPPSPPLPGAPVDWAASLTEDELWDMVHQRAPEARVNEVVRGLLGWRGSDAEGWDASEVPKAWADMYGEKPPDFIGDPTDYSPEKDRPVKMAMQKLTREIPDPYKRGLKEFGFKGYKIHELTPNKTRRATAVNWILYYLKSRSVGIFSSGK